MSTSGRHFGTFIGCLWDVPAKRKTMKQLTLLCFRHTFDEIKLKIMQRKCILCERFKIDVLGTSQSRYPMGVFSGRFEDVHSTVLQNCKNMHQLTLQYFTQHIS